MNLLEVQGLRKTYPAFRLEDVSFSVPEGAVIRRSRGVMNSLTRTSPDMRLMR